MLDVRKIFAILACAVAIRGQMNWCEIEEASCQGQGRHIACENTEFPQGKCQNKQLVPIDEDLKIVILARHNRYRSQLAIGHVPRFPKAAKMEEMVWDDQLAYLAQQHVKHCSFMHDECRATEEFPTAGQNLAFTAEPTANVSYPSILDSLVDLWWKEHEKTKVTIVDELRATDSLTSGHFAQMAKEANTHIGCGYLTYEYDADDTHWFSHMLTCNYADNNWLGQPTYTPGDSCSQCKDLGKACSKKYPGLCAASLI
ncbi:antigen 5 like allergen Cul n 1-like [Lutzomyia longipalpis]|uniref:Putative salivary secreted antigen-5 protein ag5-2 n=1 Tax=Lutzomyia longipalpis TaxID=7200 RepID=A0A1B0C929_LUTLO|nr:antigen 5 like allergen Cul n 1-like [Lutzomyia longipalpis]